MRPRWALSRKCEERLRVLVWLWAWRKRTKPKCLSVHCYISWRKTLPWNVLLFPSGPQPFQIPRTHIHIHWCPVCVWAQCVSMWYPTVVKKLIFGPSERLQNGLYSAMAHTKRCSTLEQRSKLTWSGKANSRKTLPPNVSLYGDSTANWHHPL